MSTPSRPIETQLWLIRALTVAGMAPAVLIEYDHRDRRQYYELAGARQTHLWTEFSDDLDLASDADRILEGLGSAESLLTFEYASARVGRVAACSAMRQLRVGTLDVTDPEVRSVVARHLAVAMTTAAAAHRILAKLRPAIAVVADCDYSPLGSMFDACLSRNIQVISYDATHRSNALLFKRHSQANREEHRSSLSEASWRAMRDLRWNSAMAQRLGRELQHGYETRDWYAAAGTVFKCRPQETDDLHGRLGIDPAKKTACIFPHISWDAPFAWGKLLFNDFDDWLVRTVEVARRNPRVNWIVKIHPANVKKSTLSHRQRGEPTELAALRRHFGSLPSHIVVLPADTAVSTHSLLAITDYCVTVRGTVGIEAAVRGIPVLTGGTGRYDRRGFTIDSDSPAQYLEKIARIEEYPRLSAVQQELAQRYAYGLLVLRPLPLSSLTLRFGPGSSEFEPKYVRTESRIEAKALRDLDHAADVNVLARWLRNPAQADFLLPEG